MTTPETPEPASARQLFIGTLTAIWIAAVLLVAVVLPAEYSIDPTGIGAALGLRRPIPAPEAPTLPAPAAQAAASASGTIGLYKSATPARTDEMTLVLDFGEGAEIKAAMSSGQRFVFGWTAEGGGVDVDMHGERTGAAKDEFTSYWKDSAQQSGHGTFVAPFDGTYGWYWENLGSAPVTIKLRTSGFYERLFKP